MDLSIIIPVYNGEKYLKYCLDSIFNQIYNKNNIEVILIDDGSTDKSYDIYNNYKYNFFKVFKTKNNGVSEARNLGIQSCSGKWIMFVDSDDYLTDNWYEIISKHFNDNMEIIYFLNNINQQMSKIDIFDNMFGIKEDTAFFGSPVSRIFSRDLLIKNNIKFIKNMINGEDLLFNFESIIKSQKYIIDGNGFYKYRLTPSSVTNKFNQKIFESDIYFHKKFIDICEKNDILNYEKYYVKNIQNAVKMIIYRVSLTGKIKNYYLLKAFESEPYYHIIKKSKNNLILKFIKLKLYREILCIYIIKNKILRRKHENIIDI